MQAGCQSSADDGSMAPMPNHLEKAPKFVVIKLAEVIKLASSHGGSLSAFPTGESPGRRGVRHEARNLEGGSGCGMTEMGMVLRRVPVLKVTSLNSEGSAVALHFDRCCDGGPAGRRGRWPGTCSGGNPV